MEAVLCRARPLIWPTRSPPSPNEVGRARWARRRRRASAGDGFSPGAKRRGGAEAGARRAPRAEHWTRRTRRVHALLPYLTASKSASSPRRSSELAAPEVSYLSPGSISRKERNVHLKMADARFAGPELNLHDIEAKDSRLAAQSLEVGPADPPQDPFFSRVHGVISRHPGSDGPLLSLRQRPEPRRPGRPDRSPPAGRAGCASCGSRS